MKKIIPFLISGLILISLILVVGCTSSRTYEQPAIVKTTTSNFVTPSPQTTSAPQSLLKKFSIGETATDGKLKITVNSKRYADKITYSSTTSLNGKPYTTNMDFQPSKADNQFLILDITVENLEPDKTHISTIMQFDVSDADGYAYPYSFYTAYLDKKFPSGDLLPGQKMRGEAAFEVPKNPNGLQFAFKFDYGGKTAVYIV